MSDITTIEVKSIGVTRIGIRPDQLILDGDEQVCAVEINNETILAAALEAKDKYSPLVKLCSDCFFCYDPKADKCPECGCTTYQ